MVVVIAMAAVHESAAFVSPSNSKSRIARIPQTPGHPSFIQSPAQYNGYVASLYQRQRPPSTSLRMGYQLPPSPRGPKEQFEAILPTIATGVLVALFFASPLGGIFFAITNSLFVLAFVTPFILFAGFQIWTALYTVEAPCPSCGALPVRVLKSGEPSRCLNCGALSRANEAGDGLELCNNPNDLMGSGGSLFDALFGGSGMGMGGSDFSQTQTDFGEVFVETQTTVKEATKKKKPSPGNIVDVEVERD